MANTQANTTGIANDEQLLTALNDEKIQLMIPVIVYVSVLMLLGTFGNILVLVYYGCVARRNTNSFFIVALAVFDLSICVVTMPIEIMDLRFYYMFTNVPACKISRVLNHLAANGSASTLLAIAVDRFRRLCCPLKPQLQLKHAKIAVFLAAGIAVVLSWPALIFYEPVTVNITHPDNNNKTLQGSDCTTAKDDKYRSYLWAFNIVQFIIYIVATVILIVLYSLVGRAIYRYKRRRLKYASTKRVAYGPKCSQTETPSDRNGETDKQATASEIGNCSTVETNLPDVTIQTIDPTLENGIERLKTICDANGIEDKPRGKDQKATRNRFKSKNKPRFKTPREKTPDINTIKCTILMLVITIFFIVGYLPYLVLVIWRIFQSGYEGDILSDPGLVGFNIGIRSYLIPSCVNPLLYGGFNGNFRKFFFAVFCPCFTKRRKQSRSPTSITSH